MTIEQDLIKAYSQSIGEHLEKFGSDYTLDNTVQDCTREDYHNILTLGHTSIDGNTLAIALSSQDASFKGKNIAHFIVPPLPDGNIIIDDNGRMATNFFYAVKNGSIKPYQSTEPIPLDGVNTMYAFKNEDIDTRYAIGDTRLTEFTCDKLKTKQFFEQSGIRTPAYYAIKDQDLGRLGYIIRKFQFLSDADQFVVKTHDGLCGNDIKLYERNEIMKAVHHIESLAKKGERVFLEKRVNPLEWYDDDGALLDWNIRALISFSDDPKWIDAEVRYARRNGKPVNISKGAQPAELKDIAEQTGASVDSIKNTSLKSVKALYQLLNDEARPNPGLVGMDIIVDKTGDSTIEANAGPVGGFSTIMKMRKKPFNNIKETLITDWAPFIYQNHIKRSGTYEIRLKPSAKDHNLIGWCYNKQGFTDEAIEHLEKSIDIDSKDGSIHFLLGMNHAGQGEYNLALDHFTKAAKLDYNKAGSIFNMGACLDSLQKHDEAMLAYSRSLEIDPDFTSSHIVLSEHYSERKKLTKALEHIDKAIENDSKNPIAYNQRGNIYMQLSRFQDASDNYKHVLSIDPEDAIACFNLGYAATGLGNLDEALQHFKKSLELNPEDIKTYKALGKQYHIRHDYEKSLEYVNKIIELDPDDLESQVNHHMIKKEIEEAKPLYKRAFNKFRKAFSWKYYKHRLSLSLKDAMIEALLNSDDIKDL